MSPVCSCRAADRCSRRREVSDAQPQRQAGGRFRRSAVRSASIRSSFCARVRAFRGMWSPRCLGDIPSAAIAFVRPAIPELNCSIMQASAVPGDPSAVAKTARSIRSQPGRRLDACRSRRMCGSSEIFDPQQNRRRWTGRTTGPAPRAGLPMCGSSTDSAQTARQGEGSRPQSARRSRALSAPSSRKVRGQDGSSHAVDVVLGQVGTASCAVQRARPRQPPRGTRFRLARKIASDQQLNGKSSRRIARHGHRGISGGTVLRIGPLADAFSAASRHAQRSVNGSGSWNAVGHNDDVLEQAGSKPATHA